MSSYKIVASDLDGTLLANDMSVSFENRAAIKEISDKGAYFVPATGRTLSEIPEVSNIPDIRYIIHSNGAVILDKKTGERTLACLSKELSKFTLDVINSYNTHLTIRQNGESHVDAECQSDEHREYNRVLPYHSQVVDEFAIFEKDFRDVSYQMENIEVISVFFRDDNELEECKKRLEATNKLLVAPACPHNLEIFSIDAGKGNALKRLADMLGVKIEDTISIGDSSNDITITGAAGLGLAVSNACDELKAVAGKIICSNEEHAVKYVVSNYF